MTDYKSHIISVPCAESRLATLWRFDDQVYLGVQLLGLAKRHHIGFLKQGYYCVVDHSAAAAGEANPCQLQLLLFGQ